MKKPKSPMGKGGSSPLHDERDLSRRCQMLSSYPLESELPERLQALLKLVDEAEKEAFRVSQKE